MPQTIYLSIKISLCIWSLFTVVPRPGVFIRSRRGTLGLGLGLGLDLLPATKYAHDLPTIAGTFSVLAYCVRTMRGG
jgi:hypothetical protein